MKNKTVFKLAYISLFVFVIVATYFWFLYFRDYEGSVTKEKVRLELINNGGINYVNAVPNDVEENIPTYYFRIKNNSNDDIKYDIFLQNVNPSDVNDGCDTNTTFSSDELNYELKLDNRVIKSGVLSMISNGILDNNKVSGDSINDYSLRIWLNDKADKSLLKHYHYTISIRENKWKIS